MAPTLVLLHGFTQTRQSWAPVTAALAGRRRVLAPDLPGHGTATARLASFAACTGYVRALDGEHFTLVGYSMGGRIALHAAFALAGHLDRLVLIGASPGIADPHERAARRVTDDALADRIEAIGLEAFAREWAALGLWEGQAGHVAAAAHADRLRNTPAGLASALRGLGTGVMEPLWDALPSLTVPVTLAVGERDAKFCSIAERMAAALPRAELATIAGAGHAAQLEQPEAVAALL